MTIAPGAIVEIRTEAWRVQRTERASDGSLIIHARGVSELVRDREAIFVKELEERTGAVTVLAPEDTELVADLSPNFRASLLHMESQLRQVPPTDDNLYIGHRAAMDVLEYQLDPARIALQKPRQRILIADAVGLGKTLECGILLAELMKRGRAKRILVVAISSMLTQFQKEMWTRFAIPLVRLDSVGLQRIRQNIPTNQNPFYHFDKTIVSVDTLKQNNEYRHHLEQAHWDVIVIDEAHNVAVRGKNQSQRSALAELLSHRSDALIMLSATPHDGKPESFASLMNMLDPTAIANPSEYTAQDIHGLYVRRFKKDIVHQIAHSFPEREIRRADAEATTVEEEAIDTLINLKLGTDATRNGQMLFKTTLEKAFLSSPAACKKTIETRVRNLENRARPDEHQLEIGALNNLYAALDAISPQDFSKYQRLLDILRNHAEFQWTGRKSNDRLVIFTERIETLNFLRDNLLQDLQLDPKRVATLHGTMSDVEQQAIVDSFGQEKSDLRLLIASDVASEGINLHYQCHRMIHFDIPWSLMVFRQRNGRIDRYGQSEKPLILYLSTRSNNAKFAGDVRVLNLLTIKDDQATKNIGDPSALLNAYDVDAEEAITASVIEGAVTAEQFEARLDEAFDPFAFFSEIDAGGLTQTTSIPTTRDLTSLFPNDLAYLKAALDQVSASTRLNVEIKPNAIRFEAPSDLLDRYELLPREIYPADGHIELSSDPAVMQNQIAEARTRESSWPKIGYLWPLSPVMDWVNDRVAGIFGRHAAPVVHTGTLAGETVFVLSGLIPNQKSQALVHDWFSLVFKDGTFSHDEPFAITLKRTRLDAKVLVNTGESDDTTHLKRMLPEACKQAQELMKRRHAEFRKTLEPKLSAEIDKLSELEERQMAHLRQTYQGNLNVREQARHDAEKRRIERVFDEYVQWVTRSLTTEEHPFIQVIAVLT